MDYGKILEAAQHPIGLTALALCLVFSALSKNKKLPGWWPQISIALAAVTLLGGLFLSYLQIQPKNPLENETLVKTEGHRAEAKGDGSIANTGTLNIGGNLSQSISKTTPEPNAQQTPVSRKDSHDSTE